MLVFALLFHASMDTPLLVTFNYVFKKKCLSLVQYVETESLSLKGSL